MFPNQFGVYLHDNPRRELFKEVDALFQRRLRAARGCLAAGRWLFGRDLDWQGAGTEEPVPLAQPVPVYITYLTAMPDGASIAYYDDVYGRDAAKLAGPTAATAADASASREPLGPPPVREQGDVLGDRPAGRIARRARSGYSAVSAGTSAHPPSAVAARARDAAIGHAAVGIDADRHADAAALMSGCRRAARYSRSGILVISARGGEARIVAAAAGAVSGAAGAGAGAATSPRPTSLALPVPATLAAGMGEGTGIRGCGATTGVGSAFFAGAPCRLLRAWAWARAWGGGWTGGGGGGWMSNVFSCSTARPTIRTFRPGQDDEGQRDVDCDDGGNRLGLVGPVCRSAIARHACSSFFDNACSRSKCRTQAAASSPQACLTL